MKNTIRTVFILIMVFSLFFGEDAKPSYASFGSVTAILTTISATVLPYLNTLSLQQTQAVGQNVTTAIQGQTKVNTVATATQTQAISGVIAQNGQANRFVNLGAQQQNLIPGAGSCAQSYAAQQLFVGNIDLSNMQSQANASSTAWNAGAIATSTNDPVAHAAASMHITSVATQSGAVAMSTAINNATNGAAYNASALFQPSTPVSGPNGVVQPQEIAQDYVQSVTNPIPMNPNPPPGSAGSVSASQYMVQWRVNNARMTMAQESLSKVMKDRMPDPNFATWATAIAADGTGSVPTFMQNKISFNKSQNGGTLSLSSDQMLRWMVQSRFSNPGWYNSISGYSSGQLLRSLTMQAAEGNYINERILELMEHLVSEESVLLAIKTSESNK